MGNIFTQAVHDVLGERSRQISDEKWTYEHDDQHEFGELASAARCYLIPHKTIRTNFIPYTWPWDDKSWKPKSYRENLVRASALIIAEIERIDRWNKNNA